MNILYLLSQLPESTGSGIYTRALIGQASRAGHHCSLVAACYAEQFADVSKLSADAIHLVAFGREPLTFPIPGMSDVMPYRSSRFIDLDPCQLEVYEHSFTQAVRKAVEKTKPDIIHSNHLWIMSALVRKLYPEIPMVVSCHGTDLRQFRNCPHLQENLLRYLPDVSGIFAFTRSQKEIVELFGVDDRKIHVVTNGFDPEIFYPAPKPPAPPFMLLYAGKLSQSKGVCLLIESLNHEELRRLPLHLYLAGSGSGPDADQCRAIARKLPGKVTFCGALAPRDDWRDDAKSSAFCATFFF